MAIPAITNLIHPNQPVSTPRVNITSTEPPPDEIFSQHESSVDNDNKMLIDTADSLDDPIEPPLNPRKRTRPSRFDDFDVSTALIASAAGVHDAFVLNEHNKPLKYKDTKRGQDANLWRREESAELRRLLVETGTMAFIDPLLNPRTIEQHRITIPKFLVNTRMVPSFDVFAVSTVETSQTIKGINRPQQQAYKPLSCLLIAPYLTTQNS
jgi:hypothetical protein